MNPQEEINKLNERLKQLKDAQNYCQHTWTEPVRDDIYHKAYTVPGDPPGTMGIDWRGPLYVPSETIKRWRRTCTKCGKDQYTQHEETVKVVTKPVF